MKRGANHGGHEQEANMTQRQQAAVAKGRQEFRKALEAAKGPDFDSFQQVASLAFGRVQNATNWKLPVDGTVKCSARALGFLLEAVVFFTGSVPTFERVAGGFRVRAAGYYAAVGA